MKALPFLPQTFNNTLKKQVRINLMTVYKEYNDVKKKYKETVYNVNVIALWSKVT